MIVLYPCIKCTGLPYVAPYYAPDDIYQDDKMFIVRCMKCGNVSMIEYKEDNAIAKWNTQNEFKKSNKIKETRDS